MNAKSWESSLEITESRLEISESSLEIGETSLATSESWLDISANQCKIMRLKPRNQGKIKIWEVEMKDVGEFGYSGSYVSKNWMIEKDFTSRIYSTPIEVE